MKNKEIIVTSNNLSFSYDGNNIKLSLKDVNIEVPKGEFLCILGKNGSGKSTFAKHINGLLVPNKGDMTVEGINTKDIEKIWDIRNKVGMVFQNPDNQIVANTVIEEVAFGLENIGCPSEKILDKVLEALKQVSMTNFKDKSPSMLSGGQKQRIAIASVIAMEPECIVFDEPTAMLDPSGRKDIISIIKKLNKKMGKTTILITHNMEEAIEADRIIIMDKGVVVKDDIPRNIFKDVFGLKEIGLDVPQVTELAYELKMNNINIKTDVLNIDEMVMQLCQLL